MASLNNPADQQGANIVELLATYKKTIVQANEREIADKIDPLLTAFRANSRQLGALSAANQKAEAAVLQKEVVAPPYAA